jgi:hypothetical protein
MCGTSARENLSSWLFVATVTFLFNSEKKSVSSLEWSLLAFPPPPYFMSLSHI